MRSSASRGGSSLDLPEAAPSRRGVSSSRRVSATSCRTSPALPNAGAGTLLHCPYCHGWEVRDQPIGVLGTRPDAVQHALLVRQWSDDVVFFAHTMDLEMEAQQRLAARGVAVVVGAVARLVVEADRLTGVELLDGRVIPRSAVFIRPVNVPHADGLLAGLGCDVDPAGFPLVDASGQLWSPSRPWPMNLRAGGAHSHPSRHRAMTRSACARSVTTASGLQPSSEGPVAEESCGRSWEEASCPPYWHRDDLTGCPLMSSSPPSC